MHRRYASPCVAVIGSGYWGKNLVRNFVNLRALSVVCDSHTETLRTLSEQYPQCRTVSYYTEVSKTTRFRRWRLPRRRKRMRSWSGRPSCPERTYWSKSRCVYPRTKDSRWSSRARAATHSDGRPPVVVPPVGPQAQRADRCRRVGTHPVHLFQSPESREDSSRGKHPLVLRAT